MPVPPNPCRAPLKLQASSDKTLLNVKGTQAHPVYMASMNVPFSQRIHNLSLMAYLPVLQRPVHIPENTWRLVSLSLFNECMRTILEPLRNASFTGIPVRTRAACMHQRGRAHCRTALWQSMFWRET